MVSMFFHDSSSSTQIASFSEPFWLTFALPLAVCIAVMLFTVIRIALQPERSTDPLDNKAVIEILHDLAAAIELREYSEVRMIAWLEHGRTPGHPPTWTDDAEREDFERAFLHAANMMDERQWDWTVVGQFVAHIRTASAADIALLKP